MTPNTFEARQKLRGYLSKQRVNGTLNEPQEAAWWALNELEELVKLLKKIQSHGLNATTQIEIQELVRRNSRPE
jgi:hypothetical protein